jgi:hypothetical protein
MSNLLLGDVPTDSLLSSSTNPSLSWLQAQLLASANSPSKTPRLWVSSTIRADEEFASSAGRARLRELDPERSYLDSGLSGTVEFDWGPREGGGGC